METVLYQTTPQRIDIWLTQNYPYTRNFFHHLIERKSIRVIKRLQPQTGEQAIKKSYLLQPGDQVVIDELKRFIDGSVLEETPARPIDVRYQTNDYAVIYKPKGVLSHPTSLRELQTPSVVGGMWHYLNKQGMPSMGGWARAGLLHRLDKDTDGFMIIALSENGLAYFKGLFMRKSTAHTNAEKELVPLQKHYRARCEVHPHWASFLKRIQDTLPYYIEQVVQARIPHPTPKLGITKIETIHPLVTTKNYPEVVLEMAILTGRTHQIRYHLSQQGLPIIGDTLYGARATDQPIALTAWKLSFLDIDGKEQVFALP